MQGFKTIFTLLPLLLTLYGCNNDSTATVDSSEDEKLAEGGISGTGISLGPVTGFGSIYVNGIKYEIDSATLKRNGGTAFVQNDFSIGEFVIVRGDVNDDKETGVASEISFTDTLRGQVTAASLGDKNLEVMGQPISVGLRTTLIGFDTLADVDAGKLVQVSGYRDADKHIIASSIKQLDSLDKYKLSGAIASLDTGNRKFQLENISVDYSEIALLADQALENGMVVELESSSSINGQTFTAESIAEEKPLPDLPAGTELELEGVITSYTSPVEFAVNSIAVTTNDQTKLVNVTGLLATGVKVEVAGVMSASGILEATSLELRETPETVLIKGKILTIEGNVIGLENTKVIVDASSFLTNDEATLSSQMSLTDLRLGDYIEVTGITLPEQQILAGRIERKPEPTPEDDGDGDGDEGNGSGSDDQLIELRGNPTQMDYVNRTFLLGKTLVQITDETVLTSNQAEELSEDDILKLILAQQLSVAVKGRQNDAGTLIAEEISIFVPNDQDDTTDE